jgi:hypothetical protein
VFHLFCWRNRLMILLLAELFDQMGDITQRYKNGRGAI